MYYKMTRVLYEEAGDDEFGVILTFSNEEGDTHLPLKERFPFSEAVKVKADFELLGFGWRWPTLPKEVSQYRTMRIISHALLRQRVRE